MVTYIINISYIKKKEKNYTTTLAINYYNSLKIRVINRIELIN